MTTHLTAHDVAGREAGPPDLPPGPAPANSLARPRVPPLVDLLASWSWRLSAIAIALAIAGYALIRLRLVVLPVVAAMLIATVLLPPSRWLRQRGVPGLAAVGIVMTAFLGGLAGALMVIAPPLAEQAGSLRGALAEAADDVERWMVDGPIGLDAEQVERGREQLGDAAASLVAGDSLIDGAVLAGEALTGLVLTLVITFFVVKDEEMLRGWLRGRLPPAMRPRADRASRAAWMSLGGFVRGAAILGTVEALAIGTALAVVGSSAVLPVAALTFLGAFVPFVGAIVAGVVAVAVAMTTVGPGGAIAVAVVALVVQQLDNEILAPLVYGHVLHLHPLVVLLAVASGASIAGVIGAALAVPAMAATTNGLGAWRTAP